MNTMQALSSLRDRIAARRRYKLALAEIQSITNRELADMGADRNELRQRVQAKIYR